MADMTIIPGVGADRAVGGLPARRRVQGEPYGWLAMILAFLLPWRVSDGGSGFCSKAFAEALGWPDPWHISPNDIAELTKPKEAGNA